MLDLKKTKAFLFLEKHLENFGAVKQSSSHKKQVPMHRDGPTLQSPKFPLTN